MTITTTKMMRMRLATKGVERAGGMTVQLESCEVEINPKHTSKREAKEYGASTKKRLCRGDNL